MLGAQALESVSMKNIKGTLIQDNLKVNAM